MLVVGRGDLHGLTRRFRGEFRSQESEFRRKFVLNYDSNDFMIDYDFFSSHIRYIHFGMVRIKVTMPGEKRHSRIRHAGMTSVVLPSAKQF